jgi:hypothetical protein
VTKLRQQLPVREACIGTPSNGAPHPICSQCCLPKPPDDFRRRRAGMESRCSQCRACHANAERLRRRANRSRQHRQMVNRELARLKQAKSARQVALVCDSMIGAFGGAGAFAAAWKDRLAADLAKGGFAALRQLEAVLRLVQHCEENRPDYSKMSDTELEAILQEYGHKSQG